MDVSILRTQQLQLVALDACSGLFRHQSLLRRVLKLHSLETSVLEALNEEDDIDFDMDAEAETLLIQKLIVKATQPSPIKAVYSKSELQV